MEQSDSDTKAMLANPYYTAVLAEYLFNRNHEPSLSKEDWVLANVKLMEGQGSKMWLENLLINLTTKSSEDLNQMTANPAQAITISTDLQGHHDALIDRPTWIAANEKLINEIGQETWFWLLLDVLGSNPEV